MDESLSLLLRSTQPSLANYQYHQDVHLGSRVLAADRAIHVRSLQLLLRQTIDFSNAGRLLGCMTSVESVAISIDKCAAAVRMMMTTNDMFNALFYGAYAAGGVPLKRLRLQGIAFEKCGDNLPAVLPLGLVEHLHMIDCENIGEFHASFSACRQAFKSRHDERSRSRTIIAGPGRHSSSSVSPLRTFRVISSRPGRGIFFNAMSWRSLYQHASELKCLETDGGTPICPDSSLLHGGPTPLYDFEAFCENASSLEQLSIHSPEIEPELWESAGGLNGMTVSLIDIKY